MNPRSIKTKGTRTETAIVDLLRESGWPYAERRRLQGNSDRGDIAGMPGIVLEAKSGVRLELPAWLKETEVERVNDGAVYGVLVVKLKGMGDSRVADWPAMLPLGQLLRLLREAGYGGPAGPIAEAEPPPAAVVGASNGPVGQDLLPIPWGGE